MCRSELGPFILREDSFDVPVVVHFISLEVVVGSEGFHHTQAIDF